MQEVAKSGKTVTAGESDTETGLYYYRARYYGIPAGRFLSEDRMFLGDAAFF